MMRIHDDLKFFEFFFILYEDFVYLSHITFDFVNFFDSVIFFLIYIYIYI